MRFNTFEEYCAAKGIEPESVLPDEYERTRPSSPATPPLPEDTKGNEDGCEEVDSEISRRLLAKITPEMQAATDLKMAKEGFEYYRAECDRLRSELTHAKVTIRQQQAVIDSYKSTRP